MARGNVYILIKDSELAELPPQKVRTRYEWIEETHDLNGELISAETITPTWEQMAERYANQFGPMRAGTYSGDGLVYNVIEFEASFEKGEINQILSVGNPGNFPHGVVLTASEAQLFLSTGTIEQ